MKATAKGVPNVKAAHDPTLALAYHLAKENRALFAAIEMAYLLEGDNPEVLCDMLRRNLDEVLEKLALVAEFDEIPFK